MADLGNIGYIAEPFIALPVGFPSPEAFGDTAAPMPNFEGGAASPIGPADELVGVYLPGLQFGVVGDVLISNNETVNVSDVFDGFVGVLDVGAIVVNAGHDVIYGVAGFPLTAVTSDLQLNTAVTVVVNGSIFDGQLASEIGTECAPWAIRNTNEDPDDPVEMCSLCDIIGNDPSKEPDCNPCQNGLVFVMASAADKCLKMYDPDYYARESCSTPEESRSGMTWTATDHPTTEACYTESGYVSILQTDALDMGSSVNKTVNKVAVEFDAADVPADSGARLHVDLGYGAQPRQLIWQGSQSRAVDRLARGTDQQLLAANLRPNRVASFPFFRSGSQIGLRLMVADEWRGPVKGGEVSLNEMTVSMRVSHGDFV